jgi:mRNA interferase MazF
MVKHGEIYWVHLDPTRGSEIRKTRSVLVVSPDDMNQVLPRVIIAPLTSKGQPLGCRPKIRFQGRLGPHPARPDPLGEPAVPE